MRSYSARLVSALVLSLLTAFSYSEQAPSAAAESQAPTSLRSVASVREIMEALTIPASDAVFGAGAEPPKDDKAWKVIRLQALALAESANLLMMPDRAVDSEDWLTFSIAERNAAGRVIQAAVAKDADALSTSADALYETCAACHTKYRK